MKTNKLLYGMLAFAPLFMILLMFGMMGMMISELVSNPHAYAGSDPADVPYYGAIMIVAMLTGLLALIGMITYIVHSMNNIHIPQDKRTMWIIVLALFGTIGMLIYFFTWIKKEDQLNAQHKPFGFD
jgi:hypothetical protein